VSKTFAPQQPPELVAPASRFRSRVRVQAATARTVPPAPRIRVRKSVCVSLCVQYRQCERKRRATEKVYISQTNTHARTHAHID
jgi:hypothetical protein